MIILVTTVFLESLKVKASPPLLEYKINSSDKISNNQNTDKSVLEEVKEYLRETRVPALFQLHSTQQKPRALLQLTRAEEIWNFQLSFQGVPICETNIKAIHSHTSHKTLVLGKETRLPKEPKDHYTWVPKSHAILRVAENWLEEGQDLEDFQIISHSPCLWPAKQNLKPVWLLVLKINHKAWRVYATDREVVQLEPLHFHKDTPVSGKVQAFEKNPTHGALKTYEIDLIGDQTLTSSYITTDTHPYTEEYPRAESPNHEFIYEPTDYRLTETTSFVHGSLMLRYFQGLGYSWNQPKPLKIFLHQNIPGSENNAFYQPAISSKDNQAAIYLSDGDGKILQNLGLDRDVVSHELSHHIIYETLKKTTGESLLLHEGLADYFSFSYSKDPCLGESICPEFSSACVLQNQCLRSAQNQIRYDDEDFYEQGSHEQSQLISGYLWDLRKKVGIEYTDQVVFHALSYLVATSGLKDFLISLMFADLSLAGGSHSCDIYQAAQDRGFSSLIEDVNCEDPSMWQKPEEEVFPRLLSSSKHQKQKPLPTGGLSCATIKEPNRNRQNYLGLLMILLVPLISPMIRKILRKYQF